MPKKLTASTIPYDITAWLKRTGLKRNEAAELLGVAVSKIYRYEKAQVAPRELTWAFYGLEVNIHNQRMGRVPA